MIELMKAKKIIIVGAVACGAGVASRLRRLDESVKIILIDKGNYISFSNCGLPYYIGKEVDDIRKIDGKDAEVFAKLSNIDVRLNHEVLEIDIKNKLINVQDNNQNISYKESYDDLVLSLGAVYDMPEIPGIVSHNHFTVLTIPDALKIDQYINENNVKKAVVIGGGYIGLEVIEQLKNRGLEVSLVTHSDQVLNNLDREMVSMIHKELQGQNIATYLNVDIARFENCGNRSKVILRNYPDAANAANGTFDNEFCNSLGVANKIQTLNYDVSYENCYVETKTAQNTGTFYFRLNSEVTKGTTIGAAYAKNSTDGNAASAGLNPKFLEDAYKVFVSHDLAFTKATVTYGESNDYSKFYSVGLNKDYFGVNFDLSYWNVDLDNWAMQTTLKYDDRDLLVLKAKKTF
jgi:thioredoxin reductase